MKRVSIIILLLAFFGLSIGALRAQTWSIGSPTAANVTATLSGNTLTISGTGAMMDWDWDSPWYSVSSNITIVVINSGVTSIGDYAFFSCSNLTSVTIPNSVTLIGESAFYRCSSLTSVTIPNSVASIGQWAFSGCNSIALISCFAATPPTIDQYTFSNISSQAKVYVPCASLSKYQTSSYWNYLSYGNCNELAIADLPQATNITVYPNPVVDQLTIESDGYIIYSAQIANMMGKTVLAVPTIINNTINVSSLSAGVYFLKIETDKGEVVKKVIKN